MTHLETNIFPIANLEELSSEYRLYRIKGLRNDHGEYYSNCQYITRTLSFSLQRPVLVIERDGVPYLVVRADAVEPPSPFQLVRAVVNFELCSDTLRLDYTLRTPENDAICLRFLQFMLQEPIRTQLELWQPASGQAFFPKSPSSIVGNLHQYTGYSVRAGLIPEEGIGLYVEITNKFVGKNPLPVYLPRDEFPKWKGKHCIYHYGHNWYEIQIVGLDDRHVTEYLMPKDGELVNLLEFIMAASKKPIPPELAELPHDSSVLLYKNNRNEDRGAPAHLCYPVYSNDAESSGSIHARAILPPHIRDRMTREFAQCYLSNLRFGGTQLRVSLKSMKVPSKTFSVPDLKFGQSKILSVRGSPSAQYVSLNDLGATRLALLKDVGFYTAEALDRQYFIIPRSVADSYGKQFLNDLYRNVNELFTQEGGYTPVVVTYNDTGPKTFSFQGRAILEAVRAECKAPGYGVVMIHHITDRQNRQEDKLAGMVTQELRKLDICVAIIHRSSGKRPHN